MNVQLRDVQSQDLALFFEHQRDPVAVALVIFRSRDQAEFAQHWAKLLADDSCLKKTIVVASAVSAEKQPAGNIAVSADNVASAVSADYVASAVSAEEQIVGHIGSWTAEGRREIGYWIDRSFWGRGVGTAALSAFLQLEPARPLHAGVAKHNAASIRILQKCGFTVTDTDDTHILLTLTAKL